MARSRPGGRGPGAGPEAEGRQPSGRSVAGARVGPRGQHALALGGYLGLWLAMVGPWILPHPSDRVLSVLEQEASVFVWSLRWWPHALAGGTNPLFSRAVWAPTGINLAWVPTSPGPAVLAAPVTVALGAVGPVVAFNLLSLAAPPLAAWTAYLLCRRVTGALWPALAGGFVFGFSPDVLREVVQGHLNLSLVLLVPVAASLVLRRLQGGMSRGRFVLLLAAVLVGQFSISTEVFATMAVVGAPVWAGAVLLAPRQARGGLVELGGLVALSYALAAAAVSPYLYVAVAFPDAVKPPGFRGIATGLRTASDLLRFVVPGPGFLLGTGGRGWLSNFWYFGGPLLLLLALAGTAHRRTPGGRVLALAFAVSVVLALGSHLPVGGADVPLPWAALDGLPLIGRARPGRLVVYAFLVASVAVAVWATGIRGRDRRSVARAVLLAAVGASLLPGFASPRWTSSVAVPPFLSTGAYRQHLSPGEVVLVVAGPGVQLLWQAHADLYFRTAGWYRGFRPADYPDAGTALALGRGSTTVRERVVRSFLRDHRVTAILAAPGYQRAADRLASVVGAPEVEVGGVILIRVPPGPPAGAGG